MNIFFNNTIEIYTVTLMNIFGDIYVKQKNNDLNDYFYYNIPVIYGDFNKYTNARKFIEEKNNEILSGYEQVPISSFILKGLSFNNDNDTTNTVTYEYGHSNELDTTFRYRTPIPVTYNYNFKLWVRTISHMGQIIEQIFPYFSRPFNIKLSDFNDIEGLSREVIIKMDNESLQINHEDNMDINTADNYNNIEISFDFSLEGVMHFPIRTNLNRIEKISVNFDTNDEENYLQQNSEHINNYIDILEQKKLNYKLKNGAVEKLYNDVRILNHTKMKEKEK